MPKKSSRRTKKKRPITPEDLLKFRLASSPQISPDGERIVFVLKRVGKKNEYETNLWMVDASGGKPRQFTGGNKDGAPRWSPGGSQIAFTSGRDKPKTQIYLIGADGGEAQPLTDFTEGKISKFAWSPDGTMLAVSFRETSADWTEEAKKEREKNGLSTPPRVIDDWWYRLDGDGYFLNARFRLFIVDVASGAHRLLYEKDTLGGFDFDFSPDSKELVVATNRDKQALIRPWKDELVRIDVAGGKLRPIPNLPPGPKTCVRWSPDGKTIAYAAREGGKDGIYSTDNLELFVCDAKRGGANSLSGRDDYCLLAVPIADTSEAEFSPALMFSRDSRRVFVMLGSEGQMHVASVAAAGGKIEFHTAGEAVYSMGNLSDDGSKIALTLGGPTRPAEIAVGRVRQGPFEVAAFTDFNGKLFKELEVAAPKSQWITAEDGNRVQLWTIKPPGLKRGAKAPAVLEIHGGPHAQYGLGFFHEFQVLAAAGYVVFYSNPRGSKGYGRDHCAAIRGDWGGADWTDIQAVTAHMQKQPFVDDKRMGVMGGSYGGYMTNWVIGHTQQYAAAITDRCVSNLVSMSGSSDFPMTPDEYFPGNAWDRPEPRWRQSPLAYLGNAKTPTLIIHSEGDLRCNVEQSEQVFTALKLLGVPTRFVRYPPETSHGMSRQGPPDLRIHRLHEILRWWKEYLR